MSSTAIDSRCDIGSETTAAANDAMKLVVCQDYKKGPVCGDITSPQDLCPPFPVVYDAKTVAASVRKLRKRVTMVTHSQNALLFPFLVAILLIFPNEHIVAARDPGFLRKYEPIDEAEMPTSRLSPSSP